MMGMEKFSLEGKFTIVTHARECLFGEIADRKMIFNNYGELARNEWLNTGRIRPNTRIEKYVVMP